VSSDACGCTAGQFLANYFLKSPALGPLCRHQAQVGGRADFSGVDETSLVEGRQMLFDRHEMGRPMIGGRRGIDVIAAPLT